MSKPPLTVWSLPLPSWLIAQSPTIKRDELRGLKLKTYFLSEHENASEWRDFSSELFEVQEDSIAALAEERALCLYEL